jgi:ABC-type multidrug transport system ATPase subunit
VLADPAVPRIGARRAARGRPPVRRADPAEIRSRLAYVEQETPVLPGTIRGDLLFTHPDATDAEVRAVLAAVRLDDLDGRLDEPLAGDAVSGGQRQRIALARAILRTPDVLLLDEATAQVDGFTEAALHECIRERAAAGAVVTIAHRLSTVLDADAIVVLDGGRIRATGTHQELLGSDDLYRRLVEALRIADARREPVPEREARHCGGRRWPVWGGGPAWRILACGAPVCAALPCARLSRAEMRNSRASRATNHRHATTGVRVPCTRSSRPAASSTRSPRVT